MTQPRQSAELTPEMAAWLARCALSWNFCTALAQRSQIDIVDIRAAFGSLTSNLAHLLESPQGWNLLERALVAYPDDHTFTPMASIH